MSRRLRLGLLVAGLAAAAALGAVAVWAVSASSEDEPPGLGNLSTYTDPGDGCQQLVSAITYAEDLLVDLGQERYQDFDNAARSRLVGVSGTVRVESEDLPDDETLEQAQRVARLASDAGRLADTEQQEAERARALLAYRAEAADLVLLCQYGSD